MKEKKNDKSGNIYRINYPQTRTVARFPHVVKKGKKENKASALIRPRLFGLYVQLLLAAPSVSPS